MSVPRIREAGDAGLLLEFEAAIAPAVNARVVGAAEAFRSLRLSGVRDVVPTFRSVAVHLDPLAADRTALRAALIEGAQSGPMEATGRLIDVPVVYGGEGGPDLDEVAAHAGLSTEAVIARHAGVIYRVFMLGFLPGFAYLGSVDAQIAAPRRAVPRLRVPAGSVGIAGRQTGVYPRASPGGWQIIGHTARTMFDVSRSPSALLRAGDSVRFVPTPADDPDLQVRPPVTTPDGVAPLTERAFTVLRAGLLTTVQDDGRWGYQSEGVPVSGAMDRVSHHVANALVGNRVGAATLEVTLVGPTLRAECAARVAVAGADLDFTVAGRAVAPMEWADCRPGDVLGFGTRRRGTRAYLGIEGGVATPPVLGSRSTHTMSGLGGLQGRALRAGDRIPLGAATGDRSLRTLGLPALARDGGARLRVLPGPQDDFFPNGALDALEGIRFVVTPQSDRMGYRLSGGRIPPADREMISDATFAGGLQVPPSGEPILLLSDRQTIGGYPQIATVISADLPAAGQLAPGDWVEFERCSMADALAALVAQEATLRGLA